MKHKKYMPDISAFGISALEEVKKTIGESMERALSEALHAAFEDDETYIFFPVEYSRPLGDDIPGSDGIGGPGVADPLTVYLRVGLESTDEKPTYEFNLRTTLADTIEICAEDGSFSFGLGRLSEALRELADEIDVARTTADSHHCISPTNYQSRYHVGGHYQCAP